MSRRLPKPGTDVDLPMSHHPGTHGRTRPRTVHSRPSGSVTVDACRGRNSGPSRAPFGRA